MGPKRGRRNRHGANGIYPEDHVVHRKKGKLGWVTHVGGYSYEPDDDQDTNVPPVGFASVRWMHATETVQEPLEKLSAVERPAARGDRVARRDGMLGTVVKVSRWATVTLPSSARGMENVAMRFLRPAGHWRVDDLVVRRSDRCVGRIVDALYDITIKRPNGVCVLHETTEHSSPFEAWGAADYVSPDELCPHFPGQVVASDLASWGKCEWVQGAQPKRQRGSRSRSRAWPKGTVESATATSVAVRWCTKSVDSGVIEEWVNPNDIEVLDWMWTDGWRLGDHVIPSNEAAQHLESLPGGPPAEQCGMVSKISSKLTIRWADATRTTVPSLAVRPWRNTAGHEFLPHQIVALSETLAQDPDQPHRCRGVVQAANLQERTCTVLWLPCLNHPSAGPFLETLSVYDLTEHPDFDFLPGDTVLKLGGGNQWLGVCEDIAPDGSILVDWGGTQSKATMEELLRVDDSVGDELDELEEEDEGQDGFPEREGAADFAEDVTDAATDVSDATTESAGEPAPSPETAPAAPALGIPDDEDDELLSALPSVPDDHAFRNEPPDTACKIAVVRRELKTFTRGLPADRSIFVRSIDAHQSLFRACIIGPAKTPYQDVPFIFDCYLPPTYPQVPPKVHCMPVWGNERLNPNLYADGKVCLSLLGTWDGPGWDSKTSTLHQVFLSLLALVLVEHPYYNEPGYEKHKDSLDGDRNSALYNENARLLALQGACTLAVSPPRGLARVLHNHFAVAGPRMVAECESIIANPRSLGYSEGYSKCLERLLPRLRGALLRFSTPEPTAESPDTLVPTS